MASKIIDLVLGPAIGSLNSVVQSMIEDEIHQFLDVESEVENLLLNLKFIKEELERVSESQQDKTEGPGVWIEELNKAASQANDVMDTYATELSLWKRKHEVRRLPSWMSISKPRLRLNAAHQIRDVARKLDLIARGRRNFSHASSQPESSRRYRRERSTSDKPSDAVGRGDDIGKVVEMLLSDNTKEEGKIAFIPIIGMGGLGKTTLAQLVYNNEKVRQWFESSGDQEIESCMMWSCVTKDFNLIKMFRSMDYNKKFEIAVDVPDYQVKSRFKEFVNEKRFLLVLDDVWSDDYANDWKPLIELLELGKEGSKVLVTTRNHSVKRALDAKRCYELDILPDNECRSLFENLAFTSSNSHRKKELEEIGWKIVEKCRGLPLAVSAMGNLLRGEANVEKWEKIERSDLWKLEKKDPMARKLEILPALEFSYIDLPSPVKPCFAFCSVFPKAYAFHQKELVQLWAAHDLIQPSEKDRLEEAGTEYIEELVDISFFQRSGSETYKMHDRVHDLAEYYSGPSCCQVVDVKPPDSSTFKDCRHVTLLGEKFEQVCMKLAGSSAGKNQRTLLTPGKQSKNFGQALEKLFHSLRYMRVLDLSSSTIPQLPGSIKKLLLLRYLDLSMTEIKELPNSICNLYNLKTLKLSLCRWLFKLPEDFGNLVNLCWFEIDDMFWFKSSHLPPNIGNLKHLQNWQAFRVSRESGYEIRQLMEMKFLTGTLHISNLENAENAADAKLSEKERIRKLVLEWTGKDVPAEAEAAQQRVLQDLQPPSKLEELHISHYKGANFPSWMRDGGLLQNLVSICFKHCTKCKVLSLSHLPRLVTLRIRGMQELEELDCPSVLGRLHVSDCNKLIKLTDILPYLQVMKIKRCNSLMALPVTPFLMFLILIDNCALEDWRESMLVEESNQGELQGTCSFLNLLELKLINCPNLDALPELFAPQKLEISRSRLTTLPSPEFSQRLQQMSLDNVNASILRVIPDTSSMFALSISNISGVGRLPQLPHLPEVKAFYISNCSDLESLSHNEEQSSLNSLTSLEHLSIRGCQKLVTMPGRLPVSLQSLTIASCSSLQSLGAGGTLKNLTNLIDLCVEDCPQLQELPEEGLPTSLQHLCIQGCERLTERCQKEVGAEWEKIKIIPDLEIESIEVYSASELPKMKTSSSKYHFICDRGTEDAEDPALICTGRELTGENLPRSTEKGESSTSAKWRKDES